MRSLRPVSGVVVMLALAACAMPGDSLAPVNTTAAQIAPGQECRFVIEAEAQASAGVPTVNVDGTPLADPPPPSTDPNDAIAVRAKIPRSAQPPLTESQRRILMCTYDSPEANERFPYALFVPTSYDATRPSPLIVNLHGAGVTPLQQMLFDGVTDLAEEYGYIVVAPMGYSTMGFWGMPRGTPRPIETADINPATGAAYTLSDLAEIDAMAVTAKIRAAYAVDPDRIYLMGHSMGGMGTYYLGARHADIWAALAPIAGGGISDTVAPGDRLKALPVLVMHGADDPVVRRQSSRASVLKMQQLGMQHVYLEFPGLEHEFWIRRGRENIAKVFMFFNLVSKATTLGPLTQDIVAIPSPNLAPATAPAPVPTPAPAAAPRP